MLLAPPDSYDGDLSTFIQNFVVPTFPSAESLISWTEALLSYYLGERRPICIVRGQRRGALRDFQDSNVVDSDNSPGIWAYLRCDDGGGITCSGSWEMIRCHAADFDKSPGTIALPGESFSGAAAPSALSSRRPDSRFAASGPWQAKHLSERIGLTLKA